MLLENRREITAYNASRGMKEFTLRIGELTKDETDIILQGCLINYYRETSC